MTDLTKNTFKAAIKAGRQQIGLWSSLPDPIVAEVLLLDTPAEGLANNGDGLLDPGEQVEVWLTVLNEGPIDTTGPVTAFPKGSSQIDGTAWTSNYRLRVVGTPSKDSEVVSLKVRVQASTLDSSESCTLQLVADGYAMEFPDARYQRAGQHHELVAPLDINTLQQLASATRVVGGVCNARMELPTDHIGMLREFTIRFREEATLSGKPQPASAPRGDSI